MQLHDKNERNQESIEFKFKADRSIEQIPCVYISIGREISPFCWSLILCHKLVFLFQFPTFNYIKNMEAYILFPHRKDAEWVYTNLLKVKTKNTAVLTFSNLF